MDITWLGHSCFRIKGKSTVIITDPYPPDLGYALGKQSSNIVTISHKHPCHSYTQDIEGEWKIADGPGEYEISGVLIIGIDTFHDDARGEIRGKNTVYLMEIDEMSVCHLGDLGHTLTADQIEEIGDVDVLFIPVGGISTIDASVAAEVVRRIEPKVVIPMHYSTPAINRELESVDRFIKEMGVDQLDSRPKASITKSNLPDNTQIFLLDYL